MNRIWTNTGETPADGIDNDGNGYVDDTFGMDFAGANIDLNPLAFDNNPTDDIPQGGHGTHTAGTIAAEGNNGEGITGVAQKATLMPLRVCGWSPTINGGGVYCPFSSQIAAINYAGANGATIANMSLGGTSSNALVRDALAANPNVLFLIAAGNNGQDVEINGQTTYPCSWDPTTSGIPGAVDNVVCVAASDQNDLRASFSNWGKVKVDLAAPGTETLSTYTYRDTWSDNFESPGFPTGWTNNGWIRTNASPLSSFVITNDTATQATNTSRVLTSPGIAVSGATTCKYDQRLRFDRVTSDSLRFEILVDGVPAINVPLSSSLNGSYTDTFNVVGAGAHTIAARYTYNRATGPTSNGAWLDNLGFRCWVPVGQETSQDYAFLQGTSMATPHVTGATALLKAYEPEATTMQLKQALLSSVDPVATFNPNTGTYPIATGGRLNADKALAAVDALVAPDTTITSAPSGTTADTGATFAFTSDAKTPVGFECRVDAGAFAACSSPFAVTGLTNGGHTFDVRARDLSTAANADPSPASASWTVNAPVPPEQVQPIPPEQVKPALAKPAKVTSVTVKRAKKAATIKWKAVPGATSYQVRVGKGTAKSTSGTSMKIKKLSPKKKFTVRIVAVNAAGPSPVVTVKVKKFKS
ncbi:MAG: S8 family serine peptidase [Micrococcales bacterium]|nr:S8 family serine peptidase [Micrococcales bacterium]